MGSAVTPSSAKTFASSPKNGFAAAGLLWRSPRQRMPIRRRWSRASEVCTVVLLPRRARNPSHGDRPRVPCALGLAQGCGPDRWGGRVPRGGRIMRAPVLRLLSFCGACVLIGCVSYPDQEILEPVGPSPPTFSQHGFGQGFVLV